MLKEIYKDSGGNKFYTFEDFSLLPPARAIAAMFFTRYVDLRISRHTLSYLMRKIETLFNQKEFMKAGSIVEEIRLREELFAEPETLRELATVYILMENERPEIYREADAIKKKELWSEDPDADAFFLQSTWETTSGYSETSVKDINSYFLEKAVLLNRIKLGLTYKTT